MVLFFQDVFTVSVGNLPAGADVLIKITYVAELSLEFEDISFWLPASVAPWTKTSALDTITQVSVVETKRSCGFFTGGVQALKLW